MANLMEQEVLSASRLLLVQALKSY